MLVVLCSQRSTCLLGLGQVFCLSTLPEAGFDINFAYQLKACPRCRALNSQLASSEDTPLGVPVCLNLADRVVAVTKGVRIGGSLIDSSLAI